MIFPAGWQSGRGWCVFLDSRLLNLHTGAHPGSDERSKQYCYIFQFSFSYSHTCRQKLAGRTPFLNKGGPILLFFGGNFLWWFYSTLPIWTMRFDGLVKRNFEGPRALNWYLQCLWVWAKIGKCKHLSELTKSTFYTSYLIFVNVGTPRRYFTCKKCAKSA